MDRLAQAEDHDRAGRNEWRMQPLRQFHAIEKRDDCDAADDSDHRTERRLTQQNQHDIDRRLVAIQQDFNQHQRQEDRERIVGAGSTSMVAATLGRTRNPRACIRKNTAAASVEATAAPISRPSTQVKPKA